MEKDPFDEYIKNKEPNKYYKSYAWSTAIGLQAVDGLKPSKYLIDNALLNIEGKLSLTDVQKLIKNYYDEKPSHQSNSNTEEADKVSARITEVLSENAFSFTPYEYIRIHRILFGHVYKHAGTIRDYNITKKEWVLDGDTVIYGSADFLKETLEYDFKEEKNFNYAGLSMHEIISHLAKFVSRLWQIHTFCEGNTRTTAVFFIKYLRTLGFSLTNDVFAKNACYFRNALVRANYNNFEKGIHETCEYLEKFLENLLLGRQHVLNIRALHINAKPDIQNSKPDIQNSKPDIQEDYTKFEELLNKEKPFSVKTKVHTQRLFTKFGFSKIFSRKDVMELLSIKTSAASELLSNLNKAQIIEPVAGLGKGKYKFKKS